jgi:Heparinase II/III N-terminus/Heparinase II/III-like protein
MAPWSKLYTNYKALVQLGFQPVGLNALYRFGLASGHYRRMEKREQRTEKSALRPLFTFPKAEELLAVVGKDGKAALLSEADEIVAGKVRLFGGAPVPLNLALHGKLEHWTSYETRPALLSSLLSPISDIKFIWESARFGWAFCLGRAYHLTHDEKYAATFWQNFETFNAANPPYRGPNWISGQEAALRLMAFVWAGQAFAGSTGSTAERKAALARSVAEHAARIVPTLVYARSQQNNHLLTEAAGLLTAGLALPDHSQASRWCMLGWKWLNEGLRSQIDSYGEYAQHSTNYHRLMLQLVLWTNEIIRSNDLNRYYHWPRQTNDAIVRSVHWLLAILDSNSGQTPNLGANDGSYIFPLTVCPFADYRPVLNAAARAFLDYDLPRGDWDELALWFGLSLESPKYIQLPRYLGDQLYGKDSWAYLRTAQFTGRPSHADQLHVDLWWRSLNVTRDAGTYLYNADPPWDNRLIAAQVHNTVTVNGRDQFTRAGRFLYLDWFNAYRRGSLEADPQILQRTRGRHWGYWRLGVRHARIVTAYADGHWQVLDDLLPVRLPWDKRPLTYRLHWLLPDWEWEARLLVSVFEIRLKSPYGWITLTVCDPARIPNNESRISLFRSGELVYSSGPGGSEPQAESIIRGWVSPTYGLKVPALSLAFETKSTNDVQFISEFNFPS